MSEFKDIERLLRLKRYEQPPEGFFEEFRETFKERQRGEMLRQSARGLLVERVSTWFYGVGPRQWVFAGGAASAALAAGFFLLPEMEENVKEPATPPPVATQAAEEDSALPPEEEGIAKKRVEAR